MQSLVQKLKLLKKYVSKWDKEKKEANKRELDQIEEEINILLTYLDDDHFSICRKEKLVSLEEKRLTYLNRRKIPAALKVGKYGCKKVMITLFFS